MMLLDTLSGHSAPSDSTRPHPRPSYSWTEVQQCANDATGRIDAGGPLTQQKIVIMAGETPLSGPYRYAHIFIK
jgi:hypothetical protein